MRDLHKGVPGNPKAVDWVNNDKSRPPEHRYAICIRCYCCQELCPEKAIDLKKPLNETIVREKRNSGRAGPRGKAALTADCRLRTNTC